MDDERPGAAEGSARERPPEAVGLVGLDVVAHDHDRDPGPAQRPLEGDDHGRVDRVPPLQHGDVGLEVDDAPCRASPGARVEEVEDRLARAR